MKSQHEAAPLAVLGDVADAVRRTMAARAGAREVRAVDDDRPAVDARRPGDASTSSLWPLPSTPARATISPARTVSVDAAHRRQPAVVADLEVAHLEQRLARASAAGLSTRSSTSRPTISRASDASVGALVATVSIRLPRRSTVTRSATSSTSPSLCEMKTMRRAVGLQRREHREQVARLLRGQHGRRLVEDEDPGAAVQRAQDLDALLHADRDVLDAARPGSTARP